MPIDPLAEDTFPLAQASKRVPCLRVRRKGRPISPSTLWRWSASGLRGVKLETVKVGGTTCTSLQAVARFLAALNDQPSGLTSSRRVPDQDAVERELEERGIGPRLECK